jgi:hypothetical protein
MRKTIATVVAALLALALGATPALADEITWGSKTPKEGDTVQGNGVTIAATADILGGDIHDWEVHAVAPAGAPYPGFGLLCLGPGDENGEADIKCNWDTVGYPPPAGGPSVNGRYEIVVKVWEEDCPLIGQCSRLEPPYERKRTVFVSNTVQVPSNVHVTFDGGSRQPTVTWSRNPEPDIRKYLIEERIGDGNWTPAGERGAGDTSFQRAALVDGGTYRYRVAAVRSDGRDSLFQSGWTESPDQITFNPGAPEAPGGPAPAPAEGEPLPDSFDGSPTTSTTNKGGARGETPRGGSPTYNFPTGRSYGGGISAPSTIPGLPGSPSISRSPEPDPGFSQYLPYKPKSTSTTGQGGQLAAPPPRPELGGAPKKRDTVGLVAPLAAGLAIFVLAMQFTYVVRRRPAITEVDDFSDWLGA